MAKATAYSMCDICQHRHPRGGAHIWGRGNANTDEPEADEEEDTRGGNSVSTDHDREPTQSTRSGKARVAFGRDSTIGIARDPKHSESGGAGARDAQPLTTPVVVVLATEQASQAMRS